MGLRNEYKTYKRRKEFIKFLDEFGISEDDLHFLHEALCFIKNESKEQPIKVLVPSDKEKSDFQKKIEKVGDPQKFFEQFNDEIEDFYPYGKRN